jgi:hypothetical protein
MRAPSACTEFTPRTAISAGAIVPAIVKGLNMQPVHIPVKRSLTTPVVLTSTSSMPPA